MNTLAAIFRPLVMATALLHAGALFALTDPSTESEVSQLQFADPALTKCVQKWATNDITRYKQIEEFIELSCPNAGIHDLGGIEQLTELIAIDLSHNPVSDYSPLGKIADNLAFLWLWGNTLSCETLAGLRRTVPRAWIGGINIGECSL